MQTQLYLGDGLYSRYDGYQFTLSTERANGEHFVSLEPKVLLNFIHQIEQCLNVTIEVKSTATDDPIDQGQGLL